MVKKTGLILNSSIGTSIKYIKKTFSHINTFMSSKDLTKGLGRQSNLQPNEGQGILEVSKDGWIVHDFSTTPESIRHSAKVEVNSKFKVH